jgi:hypothetical protein
MFVILGIIYAGHRNAVLEEQPGVVGILIVEDNFLVDIGLETRDGIGVIVQVFGIQKGAFR